MRQARVFAFAGAIVLYATATLAADMTQPPPYMPPPSCIPRASVPHGVRSHIPFCAEDFGGWYLRGDIGMTLQRVGELDNLLFPGTPDLVIRDKNFEAGMLFGLGFGYKWNHWLRTDITGEYRGETGFHGLDTWNDGVVARFNNYTGKKSEWLFLANAYVDLGTWWRTTPFVGVGFGVSRITIHSFRDMGIDGFGSPTLAYGDAASKWNFAWAIHAGLAYQATKNMTVEFAYRYVHLGNGQSGDLVAYDGTNMFNNPMEFKNISSHDLKLGIRWALDGGIDLRSAFTSPAPYYAEPQPTYAQPPSVYAPPPAYQQPQVYQPQPAYQPPEYSEPVYQQPLRHRG